MEITQEAGTVVAMDKAITVMVVVVVELQIFVQFLHRYKIQEFGIMQNH